MDPTPARRKLLRGSLAAPLVFTVTSPLAQSVTSFQQCIARVADQPQPSASQALTSTDDKVWLRTSVDIFDVTGPNKGKYYQSPMDRLYYVINTSTYACPTGLLLDQTSDHLTKSGTAFALVYIDSTGRQVGIGLCKPASGFAVTASCWNSFNTVA